MDEDCGEMGMGTAGDLRQSSSSRLSEAAASDNEEVNMGDGSMMSVEGNENSSSRLMRSSRGGSGARNRRAKFHSETDIKKSLEEFSRSFQLTKGERFRTGSGTNLNNNNFVKNFAEDTGEDDEAASEESGDRVGNLTSVTTGGGGVGTKLMNRTHAQMPCPEFRRSPARSTIL